MIVWDRGTWIPPEDDHTIRSVPGRLQRMEEDPLRPVLKEIPDLEAGLARLAQRARG